MLSVSKETAWKIGVKLEEIIFLKYYNLLKYTATLQQHFPLDVFFYILI